MKWIRDFDLFLFDFDGLLVNTEHIHFQAYINILKNRGLDPDWSFEDFCLISHTMSEGLREAIHAKFPALREMSGKWEALYSEKKAEYSSLLKNTKVQLMPGVENLLSHLKKMNKRCCIVTNSLFEHVQLIINRNPILKDSISHSITREDYLNPKPDPECYLRAIELYGKKGDRIVGFEDSLKGIEALLNTPALSVLICPSHHPQLDVLMDSRVVYFESFKGIPDDFSSWYERK